MMLHAELGRDGVESFTCISLVIIDQDQKQTFTLLSVDRHDLNIYLLFCRVITHKEWAD